LRYQGQDLRAAGGLFEIFDVDEESSQEVGESEQETNRRLWEIVRE
jgi:hypothetical protein